MSSPLQIAILLVGGRGTRLRPLTLTTPKPLLPLLNRPFIDYQLKLLREAGLRTVVLAMGHLSARFLTLIKKTKTGPLKILIAKEKNLLGTGGAIRNAFDLLNKKTREGDEPILIFNGDNLFEINIRQFHHVHRARGAAGSLALRKVPDPRRFGVVKIDAQGRVRRFLEKPRRNGGPAFINAGAYILNASLIRKIPSGRIVSVEREVFPAQLKAGERLYGYQLHGYWNDIGTPATFLKVHGDLLARKNYWTGRAFLRKRGLLAGTNARIGPRLKIQGRVLVGNGSRVGESVRFEGYVCLGNHVRVESGCTLRDSVVFDHVRIGKGAQVQGTIIGPKSRVGSNSILKEGSVFGEGTYLPPFTRC